MQGFEFVKDRESLEPGKEEAAEFMEIVKDHGILVGKGGLLGNVIRMGPPMCITEEDVKYTLHVFDLAISKI